MTIWTNPYRTTRYACHGPVRGWCGIWHRTAAAAVACTVEDRRICAGLPGGDCYSDRTVRVCEPGDLPSAGKATEAAADAITEREAG